MDPADVKFKFEIKLQRLSAIALAVALWKTPAILQKMRENGVKMFETKTTSIFDSEIRCEITNDVLNHAESLNLPQELLPELKAMIVLIGEKIIFWFTHVHNCKLFRLIHAIDLLHFKCYGVIDEFKVYQELREIPGCLSCDMNPFNFFYMACTVADVEFLSKQLEYIALVVECFISMKIKNVRKFKVNSAMTILILFVEANGVKEKFDELYSALKSVEYPTGSDKMFLTCVGLGHKAAAEYFYKKLKVNDRDRILYQAAEKCVDVDNNNIHYGTERMTEMLVFVVNKMSREKRREFLLMYGDGTFFVFSRMWPCDQFSMPLIKFMWSELVTGDMMVILKIMVDFVIVYTKNQFQFVQNFTLLPLLKDVLLKVPRLLKISFFYRFNKIFELFEVKNFESINVIVNDKDLKKGRFSILNISKHLEEFIKKGGDTSQINKYMELFHLSEDERKKFLKFSDDFPLKLLLKEKRFSEAKDVFAWQCELYGGNNVEHDKK